MHVCVCVLVLSEKTAQPCVYLAASFNSCLACKREMYLKMYLAVNLLSLC